jgi:glycosyltransferase involved in cell wall biosynthesis
VVIANGIRLEQFKPDAAARAAVRAELGIAADALVVGMVGRIDEFKNQPLLLAAIAPRLGPAVHVVFVGDGPTRAGLDAAVAALPPAARAAAHVLGRRMDVARLLPAFDVFALSSKSEGLPLVVPEAMAAGLPVVATAVGGLPTVIDDGVTGYLTAVDRGELAAALGKLLDDPGGGPGDGRARPRGRAGSLLGRAHVRRLPGAVPAGARRAAMSYRGLGDARLPTRRPVLDRKTHAL